MFPNLLKIEEISDGDTTFKGKMLDVIKSEFPKDKASYISLMKKRPSSTDWGGAPLVPAIFWLKEMCKNV